MMATPFPIQVHVYFFIGILTYSLTWSLFTLTKYIYILPLFYFLKLFPSISEERTMHPLTVDNGSVSGAGSGGVVVGGGVGGYSHYKGVMMPPSAQNGVFNTGGMQLQANMMPSGPSSTAGGSGSSAAGVSGPAVSGSSSAGSTSSSAAAAVTAAAAAAAAAASARRAITGGGHPMAGMRNTGLGNGNNSGPSVGNNSNAAVAAAAAAAAATMGSSLFKSSWNNSLGSQGPHAHPGHNQAAAAAAAAAAIQQQQQQQQQQQSAGGWSGPNIWSNLGHSKRSVGQNMGHPISPMKKSPPVLISPSKYRRSTVMNKGFPISGAGNGSHDVENQPWDSLGRDTGDLLQFQVQNFFLAHLYPLTRAIPILFKIGIFYVCVSFGCLLIEE